MFGVTIVSVIVSVESVQVGVTLSTNITFLNQAAAPSILIAPSIEIE